ncbi:C-X-C chemokine receptor type 1-like [Myxocyprinus asiaticus]|uniref:C-X-C chemokine receptor type 1-like n=1 Tax=Myxocyprinus asiaticus TaxID=70543 RepID=UPI002223183D|nr:C-X-C chemokine receptor type 1-like [Myxocyprinus asiaticus]
MDVTTYDDIYSGFPPPCPDSLQYLNSTVLVLVYIIVFFLSLLGNTVVIFVVFFMKNQRASTDIYLMHLAIADLLFSFTLPFWAAYLHAGYWMFGTVMCKLVSGVQEATFYCCVFLLACISIDRYLAIVKATQFLFRQRHLEGAVCAVVWMCAILLSLPIMVHHEAFVPESMENIYICHENLTADTIEEWRLGLRILHHTLGFFLPLGVMIFCYSFTMWTLCHSHNSQKQKAMRIILCIVLAFVICWLPKNISELLDTLMRGSWITETCKLRDSLDVALHVTEAMAFTHCAINPILYAFIGKKFRNQLLMSLFKKGLLRRETLTKYRVESVYSSASSRQMSVML